MEDFENIRKNIKGVIKYNDVPKLNLLKSYLVSCLVNKDYNFYAISIVKSEPLRCASYLTHKREYHTLYDKNEKFKHIDVLNECIIDINKIIENKDNKDIEEHVLPYCSLMVLV